MRPSKPLEISFGWTWLLKTWLLFSKSYLPIFGFALLSGFITVARRVVPEEGGSGARLRRQEFEG